MSANGDIVFAVQKIAGTHQRDQVYMATATVESVDEATRTCSVNMLSGNGEITIENVQLMCGVDDGFLLIPTVGSSVIVGYSNYNQAYIALFSAIDKILFSIGDSAIQFTDGKLQFNDGSYDGLVRVIELTQKLNNVENLLNSLIGKFNNHTHAIVGGGGGSASATPTPETGTVTPTKQDEIENKSITHG